MIIYLIEKGNNTDIFSSGGYDPRWGKRGKIWNNMGPLKNHLNFCVVALRNNYKNRDFVYSIELKPSFEKYLDATLVSFNTATSDVNHDPLFIRNYMLDKLNEESEKLQEKNLMVDIRYKDMFKI